MTVLPLYRFAGGTAVVTGAASGIGEQLAHALAARGSDLVLLDRDAERLAAAAAAVRRPGRAVTPLVADLAAHDLAAVARRVLDAAPRPTLLVNNAGIALAGRFDQMTLEQFDEVMAVNFRAPVALTHALLPALVAQPGSHVVNVSSLFGPIAPPGQTAYCASKFALRGFSEALRLELLDQGVGVTTVHPGGVRTRIAEQARVASGVPQEEAEAGKRSFGRFLTHPADRAAERILRGVERREARVLVALSAKVPDVLARLFPVGWTRLVPRAARRRPVGATATLGRATPGPATRGSATLGR